MSRTELTLRYGTFAVLATLVNLAAQWVSFHLYRGSGELQLGIAAGTLAGLVTKYVLDKFWIFRDRSLNALENVHRFTLYTFTGLLTTAIFWGMEAFFAALSADETMRYLGAIIGLSIGYVIKFHLDRQLVFQVDP